MDNDAINHFNLDHFKQEVIPNIEPNDLPMVDLTDTNPGKRTSAQISKKNPGIQPTNRPIKTPEGWNFPSGSGLGSRHATNDSKMPDTSDDYSSDD